MKVTEETTLAQIISAIGGQQYAHMVNPLLQLPQFDLIGGKHSSELTLKELHSIAPDWNLVSIITGMQHLVDRCRETQVFYRYQEDDMTGIAAFPLQQRSKCVIICPGGGYMNVCAVAEGYPLVAHLNSMGYAAFVVHYRTNANAMAPNPMDDLACAVQYIHDHADAWNVDIEDYAVMGFSAGGHLAASFGTTSLGYLHYGLPKPKCVILGYPVITMGVFTHEGSCEMLLGKHADAQSRTQYSVEMQVNKGYPHTFLWQCEQDPVVPVENSRLLEEALKQWEIPCHCEFFPGKAHGWGLAVGTEAQGWLERAVKVWQDDMP